MQRRTLFRTAAAGLGSLAGLPTWAADRPTGLIRLLVGTPPGGTTDVVARLLAPRLAELLGQQVIVDNRAGASGLLAAEAVAKSAGDGTTLLMAPSQLATYRALYPASTLLVEQDLAPLGLVATSPYVLVVHPSLPVNSVAELIAYAKAHPGKLSYAGSTPGSAQHLGWELIKRQTGTDMQYVPYKGTSALMPDLLAGRLQAGIDNVAVLTPHVRSGQLRGLAVTSPARSALLPELPTVAASGLADFQAGGWFGVFATAQTPAPLQATLRDAMTKAMATPAIRDKLTGMGAEVQSGSAEAMRTLLRREVATWSQVIKDAGITVQ
jgi:tripartite-type tricarboxylate transporter receptor subunit TctC